MTINRESKAYRRMARLLEVLFLALAGLYMLYRVLKSTTFYLIWPSWFEPGLMHGLALIALLRLLTGRLRRRETLIALAFALIYGMVYRTDGYSFLPFLGILTVGFIDIEHRRILRMFLFTAGALYCVAVLAGYLGVITNFVRIKNGLRSAWGICYPTDFASLGFYLLVALWVATDRLPDWVMLLICAAFGAVAWFIAHSSTSTICLMLLYCAVLYHILEKHIDRRRPELAWVKHGPNLFATLAFPALALCMFALMVAYARGMNIGYRFNNLLSNRLKYQVVAWQTYGLKPFGTPFVLNGDGFSVFPQPNYTFVDSSYPLILLRYGWVLFIALCLAWGWMARKAIRCGDRRLVLVMGIIAIHSFSEHHFIDVHFNILLAMPLAAFLPARDAERQERRAWILARRGTGVEAAAWAAAILLLACGIWLVGPRVAAWLKTALEFMHYGHGEHALRLICVLLALLAGGCAVLWSVSRLFGAILSRRPKAARVPAAVLLACALIGGGLGLLTNRIIDNATAQGKAMVEADREAMEIAVAASTGKVYAGVLPEVYARRIDGLSYAPFFEDDLARLPGNTVLISADDERGALIHNGFLYVPVSDAHAIYTGDRGVVEALDAAGYHATGYYSSVQAVDLDEAAAFNEMEIDPQKGLLLDDGHPMQSGPWKDLYGGRYTMTWNLSLPEGADRGEETVCTLRLSINKGEDVILERQVRGDEFDGQGNLTLSIPFKISNSRSVAFEAWTEPGQRVDIGGISYVRTPIYDVHTFYNRQLKKIRAEYHDREGAPILRKDGWFACDYEYDRQGNLIAVSYYDRENRPVVISEGFARKQRQFNIKRQIIREDYYGADGEPIVIASGYTAVEREYDASGNVSVLRYFGADGKPCLISDGYAEVHRVYNNKKQIIRETYYGIDGEPMQLEAGYYGLEQAYDSAGNVTVRRFLDENGRPSAQTRGYAEVRRKYDGQHRIIREAYFDETGAPVMRAGDFAAIEREYDEAGNAIVLRYLDLEDRPVVISSGYAEIHREFNALNQVTLERYYGADGAPIALASGRYGAEFGYDEVGNQSMCRMLDAQGRPLLIDKGYAEYRREYNSRRKVVRESYYGVDGEPVENVYGYASLEREYDAAGNNTVGRYFDRNGAPVVTSRGYAEVRREYDDHRKLIRKTYYDAQGQPTKRSKSRASN